MRDDRRFDLLVIGGGINGVGIARDAAGRGLSVLLCEQDDLGAATSSASTKLIHGGLRYLEFYEFRLVREALREREVLLRAAPHIIWPLRFILPYTEGLRPYWLIRLGLFLYDHLGGRERLPASTGIDLRRHVAGPPLKEHLRRGFAYSDCCVQDSRLVVLNAMDAAARGAEIRPRTRCMAARRTGGGWTAELRTAGGAEETVAARGVVNATGPWVALTLRDTFASGRPAPVRLIKGSHIVVPRLFDDDHAYIFQNPDRRIVFAIPYERRFTLIGTTELDYQGDPKDCAISAEEISYLCDAVNAYFRRPIAPADVVWSFSGVRPLFDDGSDSASAVTREYVLELDGGGDRAPLLNVFGGKLTTYRRLAEAALAKLAAPLGIAGKAWTAVAPLPGGDIPDADFAAFRAGFIAAHRWLPEVLAHRYARNYGTLAETVLGPARRLDDLGEELGEGLYAAEVDYLVRHEWARTAEDILWRRSKLGLTVAPAAVGRLDAWLGRQPARGAEKAPVR